MTSVLSSPGGVRCQPRRQGLRHPVDCVVTCNQVQTSFPHLPSPPKSTPLALILHSTTHCLQNCHIDQFANHLHMTTFQISNVLLHVQSNTRSDRTSVRINRTFCPAYNKIKFVYVKSLCNVFGNIHNSVSLSSEKTTVRSEGQVRSVV